MYCYTFKLSALSSEEGQTATTAKSHNPFKLLILFNTVACRIKHIHHTSGYMIIIFFVQT